MMHHTPHRRLAATIVVAASLVGSACSDEDRSQLDGEIDQIDDRIDDIADDVEDGVDSVTG